MNCEQKRVDRLVQATAAKAKVTGMRFCAHHQGEVLATEGDFVMCGKSKRWICYRCQRARQQLTDATRQRKHE